MEKYSSLSNLAHMKPGETMNFKRMVLDREANAKVIVHIGTMEIWDGADLALIREFLGQFREYYATHFKFLAFNFNYVSFVPSGTFAVLSDCAEAVEDTTEVQIWGVREQIQRQFWFRMFCTVTTMPGFYKVHATPQVDYHKLHELEEEPNFRDEHARSRAYTNL